MLSDTQKQTDDEWDLIIEPPNKLLDFRFKELYQYRDLLLLLIRRDFVATYKQTVAGPLWYFIGPVLNTLVYTLVFGNIAKLGTDGVPQTVFYFSGTILWGYFSHCAMKCTATFTGNAALFKKIYFPRLTMPINYVAIELIAVLIQFLMLIFFYFLAVAKGAVMHPNMWMLATPMFLLQLGAFSVGFGIIISSITTKYRDLRQLLSFGMQLWMYCSAVVIPLSRFIENGFGWVIYANPIIPPISMFRYAITGSGAVPLNAWVVSLVISIITFFVGIAIFNHNERTFIDVI